ncbi:DeoR/GlpR transcriptional regulator [Tetragenococcus halophilus]|uniref:Lactose phosphotransferase system repressor n=2 Tax=Tetragenococcus halophilus TaxID=51669 RepID=A0A3G5FHQ6_TETHA|nr:DeoR/GlpR transcriptional regulator [Tetragenococcus halophilus]
MSNIPQGGLLMKNERQKTIIKMLNNETYFSVKTLSNIFKVSEMTIRRDIIELEEDNLVIKEHGGVKKKNKILTTSEKMNKNVPQKEYIGRVMNKIINKDDVIFVGAGTTFYHALKQIDFSYKAILTNSIISFNLLMENEHRNIYLTGGELFKQTGEFVGEHAEALLDAFNINKAFLATNGIDNRNITTSSPALARIQNKAITLAEQSFVLADYSKFDYSDTYTFNTLDNITALLTDNQLSTELINKYSQYTKLIR